MHVVATLRRMLRRPAYAATVTLLVAAVVLVNAAAFAGIHALRWKALPYGAADRLVQLNTEMPKFGLTLGLSQSLRERVLAEDVFAGATVFTTVSAPVHDDAGGAWQLARVSTDFAHTLQVTPRSGRAFVDDDARAGERLPIVLSAAAHRRHFGDAPGLGRALQLGEKTYEVVGVMPDGFAFPDRGTDAWIPLVLDAREQAREDGGSVGHLGVVARLAPGATRQQATAALDAVLERETHLDGLRTAAGLHGSVSSWRDRYAAGHGRSLGLLQLASVLLLAVVAGNIGVLSMDRALSRAHELGVRRAMGARERDVVAALLADTALPAAAGLVLGWLALPAAIAVLHARGLVPESLPVTVGDDMPTVLVAAATAALVVAVAVAAALFAGVRRRVSLNVRGGARGIGRARAAMLLTQIALTTALLGGAGLLLRSALNVLDADHGFDARGVVLTALDPFRTALGADEPTAQALAAAQPELRALRDRVAAMPGVTHAAIATVPPLSGSESVSTLRLPGVADELQARDRTVGPGYFAAMGTPIVAGREFVAADAGPASPVIVDALFAQRHFAGRDPVGEVLQLPIDNAGGYRDARIVGVAATVRHAALDEAVATPSYYRVTTDLPPVFWLVTRTQADAGTLAEEIRTRLAAVRPDLHLMMNVPMHTLVERSLAPRRALIEALSLLAGATLLLAAIGLYAVLAYAVRQRDGEIGVRVALGASPGAIRALVMRQAGVLVALGLAAGIGGGLLLARLLAERLYGLSGHDPLTWSAAGATVACAALAACLLPALRAARVDPIVALRHD